MQTLSAATKGVFSKARQVKASKRCREVLDARSSKEKAMQTLSAAKNKLAAVLQKQGK